MSDEPRELTAIKKVLSAPKVDMKKIAEKAGVTVRTLENIAADKNSPRVDTMMKIYHAIKRR